MNFDSVLGWGLSSDNNCIEGTNGPDKIIRHHRRSTLTSFIQEFLSDLADKSRHDLKFVICTHKDVQSHRFYNKVEEIQKNSEPTFNNVFFVKPLKNFPCQIFAVSSRTVEELKRDYNINDVQECKIAVSKKKNKATSESWLQKFLILYEDPDKFCRGKVFDEILDWSKAYRVLTQINPNDSTESSHAVKAILERLRSSRSEVTTYENVVKMKNNGMASCSCNSYLHHAWCKHVCV